MSDAKNASGKLEVVEDEHDGHRVASPIDIFLNRLR